MATSLRIEPMRLATGQVLEFVAGDTVPEASVSVLNGSGQRMLKTAFTNEKVVVTQRLWRLPAGGLPEVAPAAGEEGAAATEEEEAAQRPANKRQRKGKKAAAAAAAAAAGPRQDENANPAAASGGKGGQGGGDTGVSGAGAHSSGGGGLIPAGADLLLSVENKTPVKEAVFQFSRISDGLQQCGRYALEFVAAPAAPGQAPLRAVVQLAVGPAAPCSVSVAGEGKAVAALKDIALGEHRRA